MPLSFWLCSHIVCTFSFPSHPYLTSFPFPAMMTAHYGFLLCFFFLHSFRLNMISTVLLPCPSPSVTSALPPFQAPYGTLWSVDGICLWDLMSSNHAPLPDCSYKTLLYGCSATCRPCSFPELHPHRTPFKCPVNNTAVNEYDLLTRDELCCL